MWALADERTASAAKIAVSDCMFALILYQVDRIEIDFRPAEIFACMCVIVVER